jgi:hypothetical protein
VGAEITEPTRVLIWREEFTKSTYIKAVLNVDGELTVTNAPVCVVLGDGWRCWKLGNTKLNIAYHPDATKRNKWWAQKMKEYMSRRVMRGDLVVFKWERDLGVDDWEGIKREIRLFLFEKYKEQEGFSPVD